MPQILHYAKPGFDSARPATPPFTLPNDPLQAQRQLHFHEPVQGYAAGSAGGAEVDLTLEAFPWVELSIVQAGALRIEGDGFELAVGPGEALVIPRGVRLRWRQTSELRRLFMAFTGKANQGPMPERPVRIDPQSELTPSNPPAAEVLLSETPTAHSRTLFESGGRLRIGLWSCTPYARKQVEPAYSELMYFYEGSVAITALDGERHEVRPGEAILIPAGATNAWSNPEAVRKLFCILA